MAGLGLYFYKVVPKPYSITEMHDLFVYLVITLIRKKWILQNLVYKLLINSFQEDLLNINNFKEFS